METVIVVFTVFIDAGAIVSVCTIIAVGSSEPATSATLIAEAAGESGVGRGLR
jgi:hypothetical protein